MSECCCSSEESCGCGQEVVAVSSRLSLKDMMGTCKARCGIGRMHYKVAPGLYKIGQPDENSHIFVTGNYKMSFDALRKELKKIDAWILVLDTKGINVWCAAGKGTFGTDELINRISVSNLSEYVSHRNIILPQLGAVGVAAHEVTRATGFQVIYGPVRAKDIPAFLSRGLGVRKQMRRVQFNASDRAVLIPMEVAGAVKPTLFTLGVLSAATAFGLVRTDKKDAADYIGAVLTGTAVVPALLPALPGRSFAVKGGFAGAVWALWTSKDLLRPKTRKAEAVNETISNRQKAAQNMLILPAVSAYYALKFTGSSPYTSMSGVQKETRIAIPLIGASLVGGIALMLTSSRKNKGGHHVKKQILKK